MLFPQLLVLLGVLVPSPMVHALPLVDPGLFVIMGVGSCRAGEGYCLLGHDCTLDEDFLPDDQHGHCDGLRSAFTPSAHFTCCRYSEEVANGTDSSGDESTTLGPQTDATDGDGEVNETTEGNSTTEPTTNYSAGEEKSNKTNVGRNESKQKMKDDSIASMNKKQRKDTEAEEKVKFDGSLNSVEVKVKTTGQPAATTKNVPTLEYANSTPGSDVLGRLGTAAQAPSATALDQSTDKETNGDKPLLSTTAASTAKAAASQSPLNSIAADTRVKPQVTTTTVTSNAQSPSLSVDLSTYAVVSNTTRVIDDGATANDTVDEGGSTRELPTTTDSDVATETSADYDTSETEPDQDDFSTESALLHPIDVRFRDDEGADSSDVTTTQPMEAEERMCTGVGGLIPEDNCWLVHFRDSRSGADLCSGTLLTRDKVVTSASCAIRLYGAGPENVSVSAGGRPPERAVLAVAVHGEYRRARNDLGIIRLKRLQRACAMCLADPAMDLPKQRCFIFVADPTQPRGATRHPCDGVAMARGAPGADKIMCAAAPAVQAETGSALVCAGELVGVASKSDLGNAFTPTSQFISWLQDN